MNTQKWIMAVAAGCLVSGSLAVAQENPAASLGIKAVKKMEITTATTGEGLRRVVKMTVVFENKGEKPIKFKDLSFQDVSFDRKSGLVEEAVGKISTTTNKVTLKEGAQLINVQPGETQVVVEKKSIAISFGKLAVKELYFEKAKDEIEKTFDFDLGPAASEQTLQNLIDISNLIADPSKDVVMKLNDGSTKVGIYVGQGWAFQGPFDLELEFSPKNRANVLFNN